MEKIQLKELQEELHQIQSGMGELEKSTKLSRIECHFKWDPVDGDIDAEPEKGIPHMMINLESYPSVSGALLLIGYLHTKLDPPEYDEALKKIDHVLDDPRPPLETPEEHYGYQMVALGDKIHTLNLMGDTETAKNLTDKVEEFEDLPDKTRASILAQHGFAILFFGPRKCRKSVELYEEACKLEPDNYAILDGAAFAYGRLRRFEEKWPSKPWKIEYQNLCRAIKLSYWKRSAPMVLLADLFFANGRPYYKLGIKANEKFLEKAKELFKKAYELDPHSSNVLMRCGKAFHYFGEKELGLKCLREVVELDHYSSSSLFRLGQCLARHLDDEDKLREAKKCFFDAVTVGRRRHFQAEVEYGKVCRRLDPKFDLKRFFDDIKIYYIDDDKRMGILEEEIQKCLDIEKKKNRHSRGFNKNYPKKENKIFGNRVSDSSNVFGK